MEKSSETNTIIIVIIIQQIHHHQQLQIQQEICHYCHWIWRKIPYFDDDDYDNDDDDDDDDDDNAKVEQCNRVDNGQNRSFSMVSPVDLSRHRSRPQVLVLGQSFLFLNETVWEKLLMRAAPPSHCSGGMVPSRSPADPPHSWWSLPHGGW